MREFFFFYKNEEQSFREFELRSANALSLSSWRWQIDYYTPRQCSEEAQCSNDFGTLNPDVLFSLSRSKYRFRFLPKKKKQQIHQERPSEVKIGFRLQKREKVNEIPTEFSDSLWKLVKRAKKFLM